MIILIAGPSASGKTTLANKHKNASIIHLDDFYVGKSRMRREKFNGELIYNFDNPRWIDWERLNQVIGNYYKASTRLIDKFTCPHYSMQKSEPDGTQKLKIKPTLVIEGAWVLSKIWLREWADYSIYLDTPFKVRYQRMLARDSERGRTKEEIRKWSELVEYMGKKYIEPTKKYAEVVI